MIGAALMIFSSESQNDQNDRYGDQREAKNKNHDLSA